MSQHSTPPGPSNQPQSLQSALQMDPQQAQQQQQQQQQPQLPPPPSQAARKRKKNEGSDEPSEPRRLRRSHEACARCRSKKIKCDSKHPRCTACANAGTPCHQEDRHKQTLTLRGHTDRIEHQLKLCTALLQRHIQGFSIDNIDEICVREGIHIEQVASTDDSIQFASAPPRFSSQPHQQMPKGFSYPPPPPPHMGGPPAPYNAGLPVPYGAPYPPPHHMQGHPGQYGGPPPHPQFQHQPQPEPLTTEIKGQDPQSNDLSNTQALAKNFGVHAAILNSLANGVQDNEDLAVGSGGLSSGRDRLLDEASLPRDAQRWMSVNLPRSRVESNAHMSPPQTNIKIWLPKDRKTVKHIVGVYFQHLNYNRPALDHADFEQNLNELYEGKITIRHDQGFICAMYLVLALGTLNDVNHRSNQLGKDSMTGLPAQKLMPEGWPDHREFFDWGLFYKPEIQATISALQALILLHWYLYTERQGRTLWRLVGGLVRLAVELGLNHDPTQQGIFTKEECELRIRLWGIVMVHDRGTSLLLGRPLGIAPYDSNTPRPSKPRGGQLSDCSEHFVLSLPIAEIQADIINSLYTPSSLSADTIMRHASRIVKGIVEFKRQLPDKYQRYFKGSKDLPLDQRSKLVNEITEDEGLTLLKLGISRILLLRVLFNSETLVMPHRQRALLDAVVTAHNVIIMHSHLIRFPDIGFFVSPIPLHIAAMVILYGHMSQSGGLEKAVVIQDIWMALDVLPRMRWRWERKDVNGEHPLIMKLAEKVLEINLHEVVPSGDMVLMPEQDWDSDIPVSMGGVAKQEHSTPVMTNASFPAQGNYPPHPSRSAPMNGLRNTESENKQLLELPSNLFYPFFPERKVSNRQDFNELLAAASAQSGGYDGYSVDEEGVPQPSVWMGPHNSRGVPYHHQVTSN